MLCQRVKDGFEMPAEWALNIAAPRGNDDIGTCSCNRVVKLLRMESSQLRKCPKKRLHRIVTVNEMRFGVMPEKGTNDAVYCE